MFHSKEYSINDESCILKNASLFIKSDGVEINNKDKKVFIEFNEILDTKFKDPIAFIDGKLLIMLKDRTHIVKIKLGEFEKAQIFRHNIDRHCKINAFAESHEFARMPFISSFSITNGITFMLFLPLGLIHLVAGIALCFVPVGVFVGIPIVIISIVVFWFVLRATLGAIDGKCPICNNTIKASKSSKYIYCNKCKEKIYIRRDYFEF